MSKNKSLLISVLTAAILLVLILFISGLKNVRVQSAAIIPVNVNVESAQIATQYQRASTIAGRIEAVQRVALSFEYGGQIQHWYVQEGDAIAEGQPLVRIDDSVYQAKVNELKATLSKAKSQLSLANLTLNRLEPLKSKDVASQQLFDEANMQRDLAKGLMEETQERLNAANLALQKTTIYAPFDGLIVKRIHDVGAFVSPGLVVVDFIDKQLRARVSVPKSYLGLTALDDYIELNWRDIRFNAQIIAINPAIRTTTQTVDILTTIASPQPLMRDGDEILLNLISNENKKGTWLPLTSLSHGIRGTWRVFVVDPKSKSVSVRSVQLEYQQNDRVFVTGGLSTGDKVVVQGSFKLAPGQIVNIIVELSPGAN